MNKKLIHTVRLALVASTLAGMTGCCWLKCPCRQDCCTKKPCDTSDCGTRRNVDVNVGAHAGTSGIGMDAGIDRK